MTPTRGRTKVLGWLQVLGAIASAAILTQLLVGTLRHFVWHDGSTPPFVGFAISAVVFVGILWMLTCLAIPKAPSRRSTLP